MTSTCFSERRICTQLNPSTVKVISWYLDRMHLLFTQVHFLFDSSAGSEVNMLQENLLTWNAHQTSWRINLTQSEKIEHENCRSPGNTIWRIEDKGIWWHFFDYAMPCISKTQQRNEKRLIISFLKEGDFRITKK